MNPQLTQLITRLSPTLSKTNSNPITDASVLVAITNEANPKILLTRRATHLNTHAGEVAFAGGKHEPTDKNNPATAIREAFEEVNLDPTDVNIIGQLPIQKSKSGLSVCPILAIIPAENALKNPLIAEQGEIARIFWLELSWLIKTPTSEYIKEINYHGITTKIKTPCWRVDEEIIWGLTGRILMDLLKTGFDRNQKWYYSLVTNE